MHVLHLTIFVLIILFHPKLLQKTFICDIICQIYEDVGVASSLQYNIIHIMLQLTKKRGYQLCAIRKITMFSNCFLFIIIKRTITTILHMMILTTVAQAVAKHIPTVVVVEMYLPTVALMRVAVMSAVVVNA